MTATFHAPSAGPPRSARRISFPTAREKRRSPRPFIPDLKRLPPHDRIAERAYALWKADGDRGDRANELSYWLIAEAQVKREMGIS